MARTKMSKTAKIRNLFAKGNDVTWKSLDANPKTFLKKKMKLNGNVYGDFDISTVSINFQNRKDKYSFEEDIDLIFSATYNLENYSASKLAKSVEMFQGDIFYQVCELLSGKEVLSLDYSSNSTKMGIENGRFVSKIKAGTLNSGYSYKLKIYTKINQSIFLLSEDFVFGVY